MHSTRVFTPVMPYCRRADVIVGGPLRYTEAVADISWKPTTLALHMYLPAVSDETAIVKFGEAPTTCKQTIECQWNNIIDFIQYGVYICKIVMICSLYRSARVSTVCLVEANYQFHNKGPHSPHYPLLLILADSWIQDHLQNKRRSKIIFMYSFDTIQFDLNNSGASN